jgi:hypothetical protein
MSSVDMYVDLLSIYRHCRNEPSRIFSDLSLSGLTSTFRHKRRRIIVTIRLEPRRELLRLS